MTREEAVRRLLLDGAERDRGTGRLPDVGAVRYIKLGPAGKWAHRAISDDVLPFDFRFVGHEACARGDWDEVRRQLLAAGRAGRALADDVRELKEFYELGDDTLWFTVVDGHVWWAFAQAEVLEGDRSDADAPPRFRRIRTPWRKTSLDGHQLTLRSMSSALSRTSQYRRTICAVRQADYLLRLDLELAAQGLDEKRPQPRGEWLLGVCLHQAGKLLTRGSIVVPSCPWPSQSVAHSSRAPLQKIPLACSGNFAEFRPILQTHGRVRHESGGQIFSFCPVLSR